MKQRKLRIGIMGCADIAKRLVIPAMQSLPSHFEIGGIASRTAEKAKEFGELFNIPFFEGYDTLLKPELNIDVIYMPLPTGLHEEWVFKSLLKGKHLLVEKSLASDYESAKKMTELASRMKLVMFENFMFRYHKQHEFVFENIHNKVIGDIRLFRSCFGFPPLKAGNFRYDAALGGGALLDAGAYTVNAARWFLGEELTVQSSVLYINSSTGSDLYGNMSLINGVGQVAQLSFGFDNYYQCNYEIWGSKGRIVAERSFTPKPSEKPVINLQLQAETKVYESEPDNHFANLLVALHQAICENNYQQALDGILNQSRLLSEVKSKAVRILL